MKTIEDIIRELNLKITTLNMKKLNVVLIYLILTKEK